MKAKQDEKKKPATGAKKGRIRILVAAITMTLEEVSKPSISTRSWLRVWSRSSNASQT